MAIKIGINGFGRIGRLVFRSAMKQNDVTIVGINDLLDVNHLAYLLKYDSVHGKYDGTVEVEGNNLVVDGQTVRITAERDPAAIGWGTVDTDVVAECTGIFTSRESASAHIKAGAKKVIIAGHQGITLDSMDELHKLDDLVIEAGGLFLASPHPGGACRMGKDPKTSVVDSNHKVHGLDNVFVADSSVFPTSSALDPSLTIMGFSHIAAKHIIEAVKT